MKPIILADKFYSTKAKHTNTHSYAPIHEKNVITLPVPVTVTN